MANKIQVKRGLEENRTNITPAEGEPIFAKDTKELFIGDGITPGGVPVGKSVKKRCYILCMGQSNIAGHGANDYSYTPSGTVKKLNLNKEWIDAVSPSYDGTLETAEDTAGGNYLGKMGDSIIANSDYEEIYFIDIAVGSSFIQDWLINNARKTDTPLASFDAFPYTNTNDPVLWERVQFIREYVNTNDINIDFVLWHQGESDHTDVYSNMVLNTFQYKEYLKTIRKQLVDEGITAPMLAARASFFAEADGVDTAITDAQTQFANETNNCYLGPNTDVYTTTTDRISSTNGHFNATGLGKVGTDWANAVLAVINNSNSIGIKDDTLVITQTNVNKPAMQVKPKAPGESVAIWLSSEDGSIDSSWGLRRDGVDGSLGVWQGINKKVNIDTAGNISANNITGMNTGDQTKADIDAMGINAGSVNGYAVSKNVPSDAVFTDTTYSQVTTSSDGLMIASDKSKLDGVESDAQVNNSNTTLQGNTFNGVSQLVQTTTEGKLPPLDGSLLTGVQSSANINTVTFNEFNASDGQITFNAVYSIGQLEVFQNGVLLSPSQYDASSGVDVVLNEAATLDDRVVIKVFNTDVLKFKTTSYTIDCGSASSSDGDVIDFGTASSV